MYQIRSTIIENIQDNIKFHLFRVMVNFKSICLVLVSPS